LSERAFGQYRLDGLVGRGGMGEVHRAYDTRRERTVALKLLPPHLAHDSTYQARFRRESQVAARLTEPHIIPIHDFGEIDGRLFIDMRLVDGTDLARLLADRGPLPPARAVDIVAQTASALAAAHSADLVHRDVKPSNILITGHSVDAGGQDFVYLVDFGLAHAPGATTLTNTGTTIGTLAYMAPERFMGGPIDHRVDVYALGCVLFEALTGTKAFPGDSGPQLMYAHLTVPPPVPSGFRPGLPPGLDAVVARAMAKSPDARYAAVTDLAIEARSALRGWALTGSGPWRPASRGRERDAPPHAAPTVTSTGTAVPASAQVAGERYASSLTTGPVATAPAAGRGRRRWLVVGIVAVLAVAAIAIVRSIGTTRDAATSAAPAVHVSAIAVPGRIGDLALDAQKHVLYLANLDGDVEVFDTNTLAVTGTLPAADGFQDIALDPAGQTLFGSNFNDRQVGVVDIARRANVGSVAVPGGPLGLVGGPGLLYVENVNEPVVSVIDMAGRTEVAKIPTSGTATDMTTDLSGGMTLQLLLIAQRDPATKTGSVLIVDAEPKVVGTIPLGQPATAIAFHRDPRNDSQTIYAATADGAVSVIDLASRAVTARIPVGPDPRSIAVDPDTATLYVANGGDNTVSVIDTTARKVITTVPVGKSPGALALDPALHVVYCANTEDTVLSIIAGRS
jgi:serine/threonine-protein kinase